MKKLLFSLLFIAISSYAFSDNFLIEKSRQSPTLPIVFNIFPGFGIGSYLQGDKEIGTISLVCESIAALSLAGGGVSYYYNKDKSNDNLIEPIVCFSLGGLLYLGIKVFSFIEPIKYNNGKSGLELTSTGNNLIISYSY
jgi:hypothetical protein